MTWKSAKAPRKPWLAGMAPPPCDRRVALPIQIWRSWCLAVPTEIRGRSWGPAVPAEIWRSRLRSGSAHWDLELAVEGGVEDEEVKEKGGIGRLPDAISIHMLPQW